MDEEKAAVPDTPSGFVAKKLPQYLAAGAAGIAGFSLGASLGWSSPFLDYIHDPKHGSGRLGNLSESDEAWIASIVALGAFIASLFAGYLIERLGRKMTLIVAAPPYVLGWLLMCFANGLPMLIIGRFITGLMGGAVTLTSPLYVAEIAEDQFRGTLGSAFMVMIVFGTIATYGIGAITSWRLMSLVNAFPPALLLICIILVPESPVFLLRKSREKEARASLKWLRGAPSEEDIVPELENMKKQVKESLENPVKIKDLFAEAVWRPTLISMMLVVFNQLTGIQAVLAYAKPIITITDVGINPDLAAILLGVCVILASALMDKAGRRTFLLLSEFGMVLSFTALGTFYYLTEHNCVNGECDIPPAKTSWLPIVGLITYIMSYAIGMGPLPRVVLSEVLPLRVKGQCAAVCYMINWLVAFAVIRTYTDLTNILNSSGFFYLYAGICLLGFIIIFFTVPETKGLPFEVIQAKFNKKL